MSDDYTRALLCGIYGSPSIKTYAGIAFVIFLLQGYRSYVWIDFAKHGRARDILTCIILDAIVTVGSIYSNRYQTTMGIDISNILYEKYGYKMANFRGEVKQSIAGRKWKTKFNRFIRSIDGCIRWIMSEFISWSSIITNLFALMFLSFETFVVVVLVQVIIHFFFASTHAQTVQKLSKDANKTSDDISMYITNLYSMFGLFGSNDTKIIEQLKMKNMDIEKAYWPVLAQRRTYGANLGIINQVPILFAVYIVNGNLSTKELLVIIMTINNISGTFRSIFQFVGCYERWKSDAHDVFDFYNENEHKEVIKCTQYSFPEQVQLEIDYTMREDERSFNIHTVNPLVIKYGDKILVDGVSGSGKTTFNRILAGYYESGGVINKNTDDVVHSCSRYPHGFHHFRDVVCEISAGNFSSIDFCTSVRDQMTCIEDISENDIWEILEIVCMKEWVENELGGLDKNIKGNISDGQKLRLSLAVLLTQTYTKTVNIIIMDEVDQKIEEVTAKKIVDNIFRKYHDKTIFMVFHTQSLKDSVQFNSVINVTKGQVTQSSTFV
jgi:ABC-type transport system involved in cytochrome bd biosynthesis fused ATPase/permease subunit